MTTGPGSGAAAAGLADQLLAGVSLGLALLDQSGGIRLANRAAEELLGYGPGQLVGRTLADLYPPQDRGRGAPQAVLAGARRDGRIEDEGWRVRRDGSRLRASFVVALVPSAGLPGEACFTLELHETRVRPVEAALRAQLAREEEARERAEETSRARDEFLASLSHELRTPLTAIMGWAHLLRSGSLDEASRARALETIERNAHLEAQLLADILDVARIITGKLRLQIQDVDAAQIVATAVDAVRQHAEQKKVSLRLTPPEHDTAVAADPDRLQQVVGNLLTNAIKFTPSGGEVRVRVATEAQSVAIEIQDTGEGIAPEALPHLFERFRQGRPVTHGKGGLGLGLTIVSHIVELHSGRVRADSEGPGHGSTFTVHLPSRAERPAPAPVPDAAAAARADGPATPPLQGLTGARGGRSRRRARPHVRRARALRREGRGRRLRRGRAGSARPLPAGRHPQRSRDARGGRLFAHPQGPSALVRTGRDDPGGGPHRVRADGGSAAYPPRRVPSPRPQAGAAGPAGRDRGQPGRTPRVERKARKARRGVSPPRRAPGRCCWSRRPRAGR